MSGVAPNGAYNFVFNTFLFYYFLIQFHILTVDYMDFRLMWYKNLLWVIFTVCTKRSQRVVHLPWDQRGL